MAGFLKKLFGGGAGSTAVEAEAYGDFMIHAEPQRDGAMWRIAGSIYKDAEGQRLERSFMRADTFSTEEDAVQFTIVKAKQIIDQNGPGLLDPDKLDRPA